MADFATKFGSAKQEWETPPEFFARLNDRYSFTVDLAANYSNTKCERFFSEEENSLVQTWTGSGWLNPPYGCAYRLSDWVKKAYAETRRDGTRVVIVDSGPHELRTGGTTT